MPPTWLAYTRAAAESPEELDRLLAAHDRRLLQSVPAWRRTFRCRKEERADENTHKTSCARLLAALLFSLIASGVCAGEAPRDPKENAALQYWLAFAQLPNSGAKVFERRSASA